MRESLSFVSVIPYFKLVDQVLLDVDGFLVCREEAMRMFLT